LFEAFRSSLRWEWIAGLGASERRFDEVVVRAARSGADLVGYLNYIHPYRVQILGEREIAYLTNATSRRLLAPHRTHRDAGATGAGAGRPPGCAAVAAVDV
jgi:HPr kinase/phosphorylase